MSLLNRCVIFQAGMNMEKIKVLFVCMGNICRSPTAEGVFAKLLKEHNLEDYFFIDSAGTHAYHIGEPPDLRAQHAALERDVELNQLRARKVIMRDFEDFDYLLAMDDDNYAVLMEELKRMPVLALDEFHRWHNNARSSDDDLAEGSSSWAAEKIFQIIEDRYIHWDERLTLVATNRNPDKGDLDPIGSRFSDSLRSRIIEVNGGDLRPNARVIERYAHPALSKTSYSLSSPKIMSWGE